MADFDAGTVWTPSFHYGGTSSTHAAGTIYTPGFYYGGSIDIPPATDTDPPSIAADVVGGPITPTQVIELTGADASGLASLVVYIDHADGTELAVEYAGGSAIWGDSYAPGGIVAPDDFEVTVDVLRNGNWPWTAFTLRAVAVDQVGNATRFSRSYTVPDAVPPAAADAIEPEVTNVIPTPGTPIDAADAVGFDVTDNSGLFRRILVAVSLGGSGISELVHDGDVFLGPYLAGSTRDPITDGFRFSIVRSGGWPSSPTLRVFPIDQAGNEA